MNSNYTTFSKPLEKKDAIHLLETLASDLKSTKKKIDRAIIWGRDIQGLTNIEIAKALGYSGHSYIIERYNKLKTRKDGE